MVPVTPASEVASASSPQPGKWFVKSQWSRAFWVQETAAKTQGELSDATVWGVPGTQRRKSEGFHGKLLHPVPLAFEKDWELLGQSIYVLKAQPCVVIAVRLQMPSPRALSLSKARLTLSRRSMEDRKGTAIRIMTMVDLGAGTRTFFCLLSGWLSQHRLPQGGSAG